jgi:hypothetical protein
MLRGGARHLNDFAQPSVKHLDFNDVERGFRDDPDGFKGFGLVHGRVPYFGSAVARPGRRSVQLDQNNEMSDLAALRATMKRTRRL